MYKYFVSYQWFGLSKGGAPLEGFGNAEIDMDGLIKGIQDTKKIADGIKTNPANQIPEDAELVILFWQRFEDD